MIVRTLETAEGATHWSTRTMAPKAGISHTMVGGIWRTFGLKPHLTVRSSCPDPQLVAKVRDVVGLYMNPPTNAVVFAVDEKSQIQALQRAQPILPMDLGQPERQTHKYIRNGTLDLFAALNVATGEVIARCKPQHRAQDFVRFLRELDAHVDPEVAVHVVLDNLATHKAPPVHRWLLRHPRFHLHFTPTYGLVAGSRRAVLCRAHRTGAQARVAHECAAIARCHSGLRRRAQRQPQLSVDQDRRRDPRQDAPLRHPHAAGARRMSRLLIEITDPGH